MTLEKRCEALTLKLLFARIGSLTGVLSRIMTLSGFLSATATAPDRSADWCGLTSPSGANYDEQKRGRRNLRNSQAEDFL